MKVAIIGTGIAGNVAAYKLRQDHGITVFEAGNYIGGHTNTVDVYEDGERIPVDTGFIVFNYRTYPNFTKLLEEIGQASQPSIMSFSVQAGEGELEYCGTTLDTLFAQRGNLLRPSFYRMIRDILRFNRQALESADTVDASETLGNYLQRNGFTGDFIDHYLVPMTAAIWSAEPVAVLDMPARFLFRFFTNHGLLERRDRPQWRVIKGGSREYVDKLTARHRRKIRLNCPVTSVRRFDDHVEVTSASGGIETFDAVFFACHSDQVLTLLADPSTAEQQVLGAIRYQLNEAVLHTDESLMPSSRRAWAAWNYHVPSNPSRHVAVTYNMNILQSLATSRQYLVTLNSDARIDEDKIIRRISYEHPIYSSDVVVAQGRQEEINNHRSYFCGAYWRSGFHEDGVVSALDAVNHFQQRLDSGQLHLRRAG